MAAMEERILEAVRKRQDEFKADSETLTLKKCRKILEGDMGLNAGGLDDHKDYVRDLMVVNPEPLLKCATKTSKRPAEAQKKKGPDAKRIKKEQEAKQPAAKEYGSKVQKLKQVCKAATIAIPPSVYTRVTSEQDVIFRLKELLSKHGLGKDSSSDEIASVKRKLKKDRDLDGIDTGNIVESRRARAVPVAYVAPVSDEDEDKDSMGDENERPGNGEESYSGESMGKSASDEDQKPREAKGKSHAMQSKNAAASPDAKQEKAVAPERAAKRLADWSESDDE